MAKYLVNIDLHQNELQNAVMQNLAAAPANPKKGQHYFNSVDNTEYVWDGTKWVNALSQGDYTFANGVQESNRQVSLKLASDEAAGNVELTANANGLKAKVAEGTNATKGIVRFSTDVEAEAGISEATAVNPKQLNTKVTANAEITGATKTKITYDSKGLVTAGGDLAASDIPDLDSAKITTLASYAKGSVANIATSDTLNAALGKLEAKADEKVVANAAIEGATKTKITYDAKGLVTGGADLAESDIPELHLAKVVDVTATPAEVNILDGATLTTAELNYVDGVTSPIQDQLDDKLELGDLSVASGSANYMYYNNENGEFSLNVDSTPTASSTNLVTSGGVKSYVDGKISTTYKAAGSRTFEAKPALSADIEGNVYNISDGFTTDANFVEGAGNVYPAGTNIVCINTADSEESPVYKWDVLAGFVDVSDFITAESTDTLTNKTMDANNNVISNLKMTNLAAAVADFASTETTAEAKAAAKVASAAKVGEMIAAGVADVAVDDVTIQNVSGTLSLKDSGITLPKFNANALSLGASEAQVNAALVSQTKVNEDIVAERSATATLTNHELDADNNTISNLEVDNFKSGVVQTAVRAVASASDDALVSEKAVSTSFAAVDTALGSKQDKVTSAVENNLATWDNAGNTKDSGKAFVTNIGPSTGTGAATDNDIPTALAVRAAVNAMGDAAAHKVAELNPALTPDGGLVTWTITHNLGADVEVAVKEVSSGERILTDVVTTATNVVISFNADNTVAAETYKAIIIG